MQRTLSESRSIREPDRKAHSGFASGDVSRAMRSIWERRGLPAKLLLLAGAFVLMAEALIFLPSISNYRVSWLQERLTAAQLAALASEAFPGGEVPSALRADLLRTAQVRAIAARKDDERRLVLPVDGEISIDAVYDLRPIPGASGMITKVAQIRDALGVFFRGDRIIRVVGPTSDENPSNLIEIVIPERPLRSAMIGYGLNILGLSIIVSLLAAAVIYFALSRLFVKPLTRITSNMLSFGENPEDPDRILKLSGRMDEIGVAERELAAMQTELAGLLAQKNRLAQLGLAVSKINHDLRNMLANAQLISDRLVDVPDPTVQRFVPKLIASLDRAISFCNSSLQFGGATEAPPRRELMRLKPLIDEVADTQGLPREGEIAFLTEIDDNLRVDSDRDQLFRVMSNLVRNAVQALEGGEDRTAGTIRIAAHREGRKVIIDVTDDGPGVPAKARENLFKAFQGSTKKGGAGLGLVIASELVQAHGGSLRLLEAARGAHFRIEMPDRSVH